MYELQIQINPYIIIQNQMEPLYIKLVSCVIAGILALALCKAYDMFYNLEYGKTEYIKAFVAGFTISFAALYAFEFITGKTGNISSSTQLGGSVADIKLPGAAPITNLATQFKYNTGMPNF